MDNINDFCGLSPQLVIPTTFEECFTYEEQILYLKQLIDEGEDADLTEIEQRLSAVEESVANLNNEVAEINVDEINAQLQSINADLTELKNKSSAQADSITALQTTVTTQGTEISSVKRQVETQATAVTNLSNSLSTTNSNVTTNTNNIAANTANIASLNENLSGVSSNVSRLNDELTETQTTLAGKQNSLTFDTTPTAGSTNPVTSDGIRKAIDEAGWTSKVEWVEIDLEEFLASLPDNVTYTTDITTAHINDEANSLIPNDMVTGTFTRTGAFISSDKRYLKVVLNVTDITNTSTRYKNLSYSSYIDSPTRQFIYSAYYITIKDEGGNYMFINSLYGINRTYTRVFSNSKCSRGGTFNTGGVFTCNLYYKLFPELPIDLI